MMDLIREDMIRLIHHCQYARLCVEYIFETLEENEASFDDITKIQKLLEEVRKLEGESLEIGRHFGIEEDDEEYV